MKRIITAALVVALSSVAANAADEVYAPVSGAYNWSGFYVGANLGVINVRPNSPNANEIQPNSQGVSVGGHAGYNFQVNNFVFGVEGDIAASTADATESCANPAFTCNAGADWTGTLRARAGVAMNRLLVYGTGGVAFMRYTGNTALPATTFPDAKTLTGWTAGGGLEYAVSNRAIVGAEVLYMDFPTTTMNYDVPYTVNPTAVVGRLRASIKF